MSRILMAVMEIMAAAVILVPIVLMLDKLRFHNRKKTMLYCVFSFYLVAVYVLVGLPSVVYVRLDANINWIPLAGLAGDLKNALLNVALFVPLGVFLPVLCKRYTKVLNALLFALAMSGMIEVLQIFTFRATDVNDLMTNTFGAWIGYLLWKLIFRNTNGHVPQTAEQSCGELYMVCGVTFAVMFFVQPFLSGFLWNGILY